ncbi:MAG TPA: hypothetical protein VLF91_01720 [Candidatus Saccharimonadales bacterium]|nr:hypothetical protein [Candidatus Saccharimonadales bacterium]
MTYSPRPAEGTPLDSAIEEMDEIAQQDLSHQAIIGHIKGLLERGRGELEQGLLSKEAACQYLFDVYFAFQHEIQGAHPLAGILRVVGDDLGYHLGVDDADLKNMYRDSLRDARSGVQ